MGTAADQLALESKRKLAIKVKLRWRSEEITVRADSSEKLGKGPAGRVEVGRADVRRFEICP